MAELDDPAVWDAVYAETRAVYEQLRDGRLSPESFQPGSLAQDVIEAVRGALADA